MAKKDKKKILNTLKHKFDKQIEDAKDEIKDVVSEMRKEKTEKIARRSYSRLAKLNKDFDESKSKVEDKENYTEINWENAKRISADLHAGGPKVRGLFPARLF